MTTPHKHADLIIAWAKGAEIQYNYANAEWYDFPNNVPNWDINVQYRIKPEKKWVRIAEYPSSGLVVYSSEVSEKYAEGSPSFKRWITDRIYYE